MKKILFIAAHRPDRSPSQRFRIEQYFDILNEQGHTYDYSYFISKRDDIFLYKKGYYFHKARLFIKNLVVRFRDLRKASRYDIIFIHREAVMIGSSFFEKLFRKSGAKIIYDFDDAIWLPHVSENNKALAFMKKPAKISQIIKVADLVFAGNTYLARYARQFNPNTIIMPTAIDTDLFKDRSVKRKKDKICIGWSGSMSTVNHFKAIIPALVRIKDLFQDKVCFKVMSDILYYNQLIDNEYIKWNIKNEKAILSTFDIGIMPLPDTAWAKGKCGLKGLLYMSLGVPTIMSPVGVNTQIIKDGENGCLARSIDEWVDKLSLLISSEELRIRLGSAGRKTVEQHFSIKSQRATFLKHFEKV